MVTLPIPSSLKEGDHIFQAQGKTYDNVDRVANVPITLLRTIASGKDKYSFDVFYGMNSSKLDKAARKAIEKAYKNVKAKLTANSRVKVEIIGWVQPTKTSPNVAQLSRNRAKAVKAYLKKIGLKATYRLVTPGHDKFNVSKSRRASTTVTWTSPKS